MPFKVKNLTTDDITKRDDYAIAFAHSTGSKLGIGMSSKVNEQNDPLILAHEISHILLGADHIDKTLQDGYGNTREEYLNDGQIKRARTTIKTKEYKTFPEYNWEFKRGLQ